MLPAHTYHYYKHHNQHYQPPIQRKTLSIPQIKQQTNQQPNSLSIYDQITQTRQKILSKISQQEHSPQCQFNFTQEYYKLKSAQAAKLLLNKQVINHQKANLSLGYSASNFHIKSQNHQQAPQLANIVADKYNRQSHKYIKQNLKWNINQNNTKNQHIHSQNHPITKSQAVRVIKRKYSLQRRENSHNQTTISRNHSQEIQADYILDRLNHTLDQIPHSLYSSYQSYETLHCY